MRQFLAEKNGRVLLFLRFFLQECLLASAPCPKGTGRRRTGLLFLVVVPSAHVSGILPYGIVLGLVGVGQVGKRGFHKSCPLFGRSSLKFRFVHETGFLFLLLP